MDRVNPSFCFGMARIPVIFHLLWRLIKGGMKRWGLSFTKIVFSYIKKNTVIVKGSANRWIRASHGIYAATAFPPINSERFSDYLLQDMENQYRSLSSPLIFSIVAFSSKCPYRCSHCYALDQLSEKEQVSLSTLKSAIKTLGYWGAKDIFLSGGEPLLRKDDLIKLLLDCKNDVEGFWIVTTGWGYDKGLIEKLIPHKLKGIIVSLDDYRQEHCNKSKGNPQAWEKAISAIRESQNLGLIISVDCLVHPELLEGDHFYRFMDFCMEMKVHFINFFPLSNIGGARSNAIKGLSLQELTKLEKMMTQVNRSWSFRKHPMAYSAVIWEKYRGCSGGRQFIYVDPQGGVKPCPFLRKLEHNINETTMESILKDFRSGKYQWSCLSAYQTIEH